MIAIGKKLHTKMALLLCSVNVVSCYSMLVDDSGKWEKHAASLAKRYAILEHIIRVGSAQYSNLVSSPAQGTDKYFSTLRNCTRMIKRHEKLREQTFEDMYILGNTLWLQSFDRLSCLNFKSPKYNPLSIIILYLTTKSWSAHQLPFLSDDLILNQRHFQVTNGIVIPESAMDLLLQKDHIRFRCPAASKLCAPPDHMRVLAHAPAHNMCLVSNLQDGGKSNLLVIKGSDDRSPIIQQIGHHYPDATYLMRHDGCYVAQRLRSSKNGDEIRIIDPSIRQDSASTIARIVSRSKERSGLLELLSLVGLKIVYIDHACKGIYEYDFSKKSSSKLYDHHAGKISGAFACDSEKGLWMIWQGYRASDSLLSERVGIDVRICAEGVMRSAYISNSVLGVNDSEFREGFFQPQMLSEDGQHLVAEVRHVDRDESYCLKLRHNKNLSFVDALGYEGIKLPA